MPGFNKLGVYRGTGTWSHAQLGLCKERDVPGTHHQPHFGLGSHEFSKRGWGKFVFFLGQLVQKSIVLDFLGLW